jgi:hypothetical protein
MRVDRFSKIMLHAAANYGFNLLSKKEVLGMEE